VTDISKQMSVGLGEAMRRLLDIEIRFRNGVSSKEMAVERDMLLEALNRVEIQLGFDCNVDGVPDTMKIFQASSETSCCRLIDLPGAPPRAPLPETSFRLVETSRAEPEPPPPPPPPVSKPTIGPGFLGRMFSSPNKDKKP
jgi:hypothetical protein